MIRWLRKIISELIFTTMRSSIIKTSLSLNTQVKVIYITERKTHLVRWKELRRKRLYKSVKGFKSRLHTVEWYNLIPKLRT